MDSPHGLTAGPGRHPLANVIAVGSPEWDRLTARRAELIYKKNREGLTDAECAEFEHLQQLSRAAVARAFPPPGPDSGESSGVNEQPGLVEDAPGP